MVHWTIDTNMTHILTHGLRFIRWSSCDRSPTVGSPPLPTWLPELLEGRQSCLSSPSCKGVSLISPHPGVWAPVTVSVLYLLPGGEAARRRVPKDRHGCEETETGLCCKYISLSSLIRLVFVCRCVVLTACSLRSPQAEPGKSDAWAKYMAEVKMYKSHQCGDDDKTRPLVK